MPTLLTFALWLATLALASSLAYLLGYHRGRLAEYREFTQRKTEE